MYESIKEKSAFYESKVEKVLLNEDIIVNNHFTQYTYKMFKIVHVLFMKNILENVLLTKGIKEKDILRNLLENLLFMKDMLQNVLF